MADQNRRRNLDRYVLHDGRFEADIFSNKITELCIECDMIQDLPAFPICSSIKQIEVKSSCHATTNTLNKVMAAIQQQKFPSLESLYIFGTNDNGDGGGNSGSRDGEEGLDDNRGPVEVILDALCSPGVKLQETLTALSFGGMPFTGLHLQKLLFEILPDYHNIHSLSLSSSTIVSFQNVAQKIRTETETRKNDIVLPHLTWLALGPSTWGRLFSLERPLQESNDPPHFPPRELRHTVEIDDFCLLLDTFTSIHVLCDSYDGQEISSYVDPTIAARLKLNTCVRSISLAAAEEDNEDWTNKEIDIAPDENNANDPTNQTVSPAGRFPLPNITLSPFLVPKWLEYVQSNRGGSSYGHTALYHAINRVVTPLLEQRQQPTKSSSVPGSKFDTSSMAAIDLTEIRSASSAAIPAATTAVAAAGQTYGTDASAQPDIDATIATTSMAPPDSAVGTAASVGSTSDTSLSHLSDDRLADEIIEMRRKRNALQAALLGRIQGSQRPRTRKEDIALHDFSDDGHKGREDNNSFEQVPSSENTVNYSTMAPPSASTSASNTGHVFIEVERSERKKCMFCKIKKAKYRCSHPLCMVKTFQYKINNKSRTGNFYCPEHQYIHHDHVKACTLADEVWTY